MNKRARRQIVVAAAFVGLAGLLTATCRVTVVQGESMLPTFHDGQVVLVNRLAYWSRQPSRGDVVLVRHEEDVLIKRVVQLPGDLIDGRRAAAYRRVVDFFDKPAKRRADHDGRPALVVPPGTVVVIGDNFANSDDSRSFGPVPILDIMGQVLGAPPAR